MNRVKRFVIVAVAVAGIAVAWRAYDGLFRERPDSPRESAEEHFLYGSIGTEAREGIPYWVWLVLPRVFPDLLPGPGGYAVLGLLSQDGREMPVGLSRLTIGYPRVATNCAFCHTASVRPSPSDVPRIIPGAPAHQLGVQEYRRFLGEAASDPRFTAGTILGEIARNYRLSFFDRLLYRFVIIPGARRQLLRMTDTGVDTHDWGRGRADLFNVLKVRRLGQPVAATTGASDVPSLWGVDGRGQRGWFWDGLNASTREAVVTSALVEGSSRPWLDRDLERWDATDGERSSLRRVHDYIRALEPPPYPFPIDATLASAGEAVYSTTCAQCHAPSGSRAGSIIPSSETGTDAARAGVWTPEDSVAADAFAGRRVWKVSAFERTDGYVSIPLDGVWLRAPYLHNGSVPSIRDLLEPASSRPARFWRGYDVYDPANVGFISDGPEAQRMGTLFDVARPGNANTGHEHGTTLSAEDKRALIEFLKTM